MAEQFVQRHLSLRHLRVLASLADSGGVGSAAERLHVTQPAVSKALGEIERGLGQTLFIRRGRGVRATPLGERLVDLARRLESELLRCSSDIGALVRGASGTLLIGATNAALAQRLPKAIAALKSEQPTLTLSVQTDKLPEMLARLRLGLLDLVVARMPDQDRPQDLRAHLLGPSRQVVVMSLVHPLARSRQLGWEALSSQAWIWPLQGTRTRELQERFWQRLGVAAPSNLVETGDTALVFALLRRMPLLALMPDDSARAAAQAGIAKILPLEAPIGLADLVAWQLPQSNSPALKRLLHHLAAA